MTKEELGEIMDLAIPEGDLYLAVTCAAGEPGKTELAWSCTFSLEDAESILEGMLGVVRDMQKDKSHPKRIILPPRHGFN